MHVGVDETRDDVVLVQPAHRDAGWRFSLTGPEDVCDAIVLDHDRHAGQGRDTGSVDHRDVRQRQSRLRIDLVGRGRARRRRGAGMSAGDHEAQSGG